MVGFSDGIVVGKFVGGIVVEGILVGDKDGVLEGGLCDSFQR